MLEKRVFCLLMTKPPLSSAAHYYGTRGQIAYPLSGSQEHYDCNIFNDAYPLSFIHFSLRERGDTNEYGLRIVHRASA